MNTQDRYDQAIDRAAIAEEWFREYCALLSRDSMKAEAELERESAYDAKA